MTIYCYGLERRYLQTLQVLTDHVRFIGIESLGQDVRMRKCSESLIVSSKGHQALEKTFGCLEAIDPENVVVIIEDSISIEDFRDLFNVGVSSIISKKITPHDLFDLLRLGLKSLDTDVIEPRINVLTSAQKKVMNLLTQGLNHSEIASRLGISQNTVEVHVSNIKNKTGIGETKTLFFWWLLTKKM